LQLTDSTSSTSTTTAATPNSVKTAYDLAVIKNPTIKMISGLYYKTPSRVIGQVTATSDRTVYTVIYVPVTQTVDRIAILTSSTFSGTGTVRLGIYNSTNGLPSTVLLDAGTVTPTAASTVYQITISQSLTPGFYWLAFNQQGTAPTAGVYLGASPTGNDPNPFIGSASATLGGGTTQSVIESGITGAFATAGSVSALSGSNFVWVRAV
jgi:hypothetical protein